MTLKDVFQANDFDFATEPILAENPELDLDDFDELLFGTDSSQNDTSRHHIEIPSKPLHTNSQDKQSLADLDREIQEALSSDACFEAGDSDFDNARLSPFSPLNEVAISPSTSTAGDDVDALDGKQQSTYANKLDASANMSTIAAIKEAMKDTLKLNVLYVTLKSTYLKLCREFNYLLEKFNENERVKLALINENNELRRLLTDFVKERELEHRKIENPSRPQKRKKTQA